MTGELQQIGGNKGILSGRSEGSVGQSIVNQSAGREGGGARWD